MCIVPRKDYVHLSYIYIFEIFLRVPRKQQKYETVWTIANHQRLIKQMSVWDQHIARNIPRFGFLSSIYRSTAKCNFLSSQFVGHRRLLTAGLWALTTHWTGRDPNRRLGVVKRRQSYRSIGFWFYRTVLDLDHEGRVYNYVVSDTLEVHFLVYALTKWFAFHPLVATSNTQMSPPFNLHKTSVHFPAPLYLC